MKAVQIVGVLNVTPDSFHDGGKFADIPTAIAQAKQMLADGADIIDIGGESTGPKSVSVSLEEELRRVIPVVEAVKKALPSIKISVDTWKSEVAKAALDEGATMINDVTAGRGDPAIFLVVAKSSADYVMMYSKDASARTTIDERQYKDVIGTVHAFLKERKALALKAGIKESHIILDPGLGHFVSSDPRYSLEIIARLREFSDLGPVYISPSRKSFLAGPDKLPTKDRLPGTIAASAICVMNGATYVRTHDVKEVRRACEIAELIRREMEN